MSRLDAVHPDLRSAARFLPTWLPGLSGLGPVRAIRRLAAAHDPGTADGVTRERTEHGDLFVPDGLTRPGGALLWIHGGGLLLGTARQDSDVASAYARDLGVVVLSAEYRLAPEHPYPAPLEDCYDALLALLAHPLVDRDRVAVGGASAGGGLAAALAQVVRDRRPTTLVGQLLVYPMLDDRTCTRTPANAREHRVWNNTSNRLGWSSYLGAEPGAADVTAPAVPARAEDLSGLPPAWIGVGTSDLFYDEDLAYAERLRAAGVACSTGVLPGAFHGFDRLAPSSPSVRDFVAEQTRWLADRLSS